MTIGQKLHELRIAKDIPAAALDERFGIQRGHWMNWESGFPEPDLPLIDTETFYDLLMEQQEQI